MKPALATLLLIMVLLAPAAQSRKNLTDEVWQMEEQYWQYVGSNNTVSYKTLCLALFPIIRLTKLIT